MPNTEDIIADTVSITNTVYDTEHLVYLLEKSQSALGIYSSGTTGVAKQIYQPVGRLLKSVQRNESYTCTSWLLTYNPSHSAGIQLFLQAIFNKACIVYAYKSARENVLTLLDNHSIDYVSATPTFYRSLAPYDFVYESVKGVTLNGEKSTQGLIDSVKNIFPNARIRNIYGSTESGPLMSSENAYFIIPPRLIDKVRIENDELILHESLVSKSVHTFGWYRTGDLVKVIEENPLTIEFISRSTRILNVGGQNVNPQEVEEVLLEYDAIKDVRVYGRKHAIVGNLICAEVQLNEGFIFTEKDYILYCKSRLAGYKVPKMFTQVDIIGKGNTGKKQI
jgi:acyl-CoA synthetase (AMP-forming)/AMP-acid ligase II